VRVQSQTLGPDLETNQGINQRIIVDLIFRNLSVFGRYKTANACLLSKCTKAWIIFLAVILLFQSFSSNEKKHFIFLFILKLQIVTESTAVTRNRVGCSLTTRYL